MKKLVIKIGSSSIIDDNKLDNRVIVELIRQLEILKNGGISPIIVTSGAVALGAFKLNVAPKDIKTKQACASVGQVILMNGYTSVCDMFNLKCAQILVNHTDFSSRKRMLNLHNTIETLLNNDIIPIINENDALAVEEIMVGDNDTLSALVSCLVDCSMLVLMSDVCGLYDSNPKLNKDAKLIKLVPSLTTDILNMASDSSTNVGTGGMITKLNAANIVSNKGIDMIIMDTQNIDELHNCFSNEYSGTKFIGNFNKLTDKKSWLLYSTISRGELIINEGCYNALLKRGSLLSVGLIDSNGIFDSHDVISIIYDNKVIAKGIVNYDCILIDKLKDKIINDDLYKVCVHANNIVLI